MMTHIQKLGLLVPFMGFFFANVNKYMADNIVLYALEKIRKAQ